MIRGTLIITLCFFALEIFDEVRCQDLSSWSTWSDSGFIDFQPRGRSGRPEPVFRYPPRFLSSPESLLSLESSESVSGSGESENGKEHTHVCGAEIACPVFFSHRYPTADGDCNNRVNPRRGAKERSFKRLLTASYDDGTETLRRAVNGSTLPSARLISNNVQGRLNTETPFTHMLPFWGQFLVHDIALTLEPEGSVVHCTCSDHDNPECINIPIPRSDPQYKSNLEKTKTCFITERSEPVADSEDCRSDVRQQFNDISGYLDLGLIYGNAEEHLNAMRTHSKSKKGELLSVKSKHSGFGDLLPSSNYSEEIIPAANVMFCPKLVKMPPTTACRVSGEARTNENCVLHSHHTVWMRLHNAVVKELKRYNRKWSSERLLKVAKLIVTALHQRVTFEHFLPAIIGKASMKRFDLNLQREGYYYGYDSSYSAGVSNSFTTAAFRMGHTLINQWFSRPNKRWSRPQADAIRVKTSLFNVGQVTSIPHSGGPNSFIRGLANDSALTFDPTFADDLRNFVDRPNVGKDGYGFDLLARNIQRGRDHGLPPYVDFREFCGFSVPRQFSDLRDFMTEDRIAALQSSYSDVRDIDLYAGGISESSAKGATVGPTFACIIGYQFRDLKKGDRFWHENAPPVGSFTMDQLKAIRSVPFPSLLCVMVSDMLSIQPKPMEKVSRKNRRLDCSAYSPLNLAAFEDPAPTSYSEETLQDTVNTAWFSSQVDKNEGEDFTVSELYQWLLTNRPDEVCRQVTDKMNRTVNGRKQVRFRCLPGTIVHSDFPPVLSDKYYWTRWYNGSSSPTRSDYRVTPEVTECEVPYAIQAQTLDGVPAGEAGDVFNRFSATEGLVCFGSDQRSGQCNQYRARFLCR